MALFSFRCIAFKTFKINICSLFLLLFLLFDFRKVEKAVEYIDSDVFPFCLNSRKS